jgi:cytochrome c peroxidase
VDIGAYKAPTLRNIAVSAPYMHDGRFQTLDEVIDFYSDSVKNSATISPLMHHVMQGGVRLTAQEKSQLKAFLNTLTDDRFLDNTEFSRP